MMRRTALAANGQSLPSSAHLEPLMTPREVALVLGVSRSWLYRASRGGELPVLYVGRQLRFRRADVDSYVERYRATKEGQQA